MNRLNKLSSMLLCTALLMAGCAKDDKTDNGSGGDTSSDTGNVREVLMTLKNQLALQKPTKAGETKADEPIATAAENAISTLDVYVFGASTETGNYTFQERFAYRANSDDKLPANATELQLNTSGADGKETTGLMKIQKGLFVKLYCIANDTTLFDPATNAIIKDSHFKPLTLDETGTKILTEGLPEESSFTTWHTRLFTAAAKADTLATPLAMTGSYVTPVDLTSFDNSARVQLSFRLTRLAARFDINNNAEESRFTIESVSMGNARRGSGYFPIRVYGDLPKAKPDELITLTPRALTADGANTGLATGAFYSYPASKEDQAFMVLKGKYKVNETEKKDVSYQIPFKQIGSNGDAMWLDIANNHRYTIAITKANEYHLDANILVADWSDSGVIDYTPDNKPGELVVTIPQGWDKSQYDADANCVRMSLDKDTKNTFTITTTANSALGLNKIYAGGVSGAKYDWLNISEPTTTASGAAGVFQYTYTAKLTKPYPLDRYPRVTLRFFSLTDGSENLLFVEPLSVPIPVETEQVTKAPNGISDNPNYFDPNLGANLYRITGSSVRVKNSCPDGVDIVSKPSWIEVKEISANTVETVFELTLLNRDTPDKTGTVVFKNKSQNDLKTDVVVTLLDAPVTPDFSDTGIGNIVTPPTASTPADLGILIKADQKATVNTTSMDGVRVKVDYDGGPEWLSYTGAETGTKAAPEAPAAQAKTPALPMAAPKAAATTAGSASLLAVTPRAAMSKPMQIVFSPVVSKLTNAKKAIVTLQNIIGGKDSSFTISPIMQAATAVKGKEASIPVQDVFDAAKKTAVLYQLPGDNKDKSQMQIAVSSLGGSSLEITGKEATIVSPADSKANEANYILKPALPDNTAKATVTLHAKNYTDKTKMTDYTITVLRSDLTGDTKATLKTQPDQTVTFKATSHEGFSIDPKAIVWQPSGETGGAIWFKVPTTNFEKGENKPITLTATATTATAQVRPATLTLKNKITNGGDLRVVVTPEYVVPTLSTPMAADPTQNTLTAGPTTSTIKLYRVDDSKITFKATAIGGSSITEAKGVIVKGGNTYNTENTYTVTLEKGATEGSFNVVNKSDPNKKQTVTVNAPEATMTAKDVKLGASPGTPAKTIANSPEGFKVNVDWSTGQAWFDLNKTNFTKGSVEIQMTVKQDLNRVSIKPATVKLTNLIRGGKDVTFTVTPELGEPVITRKSATPSGNTPEKTGTNLNGSTTLTLYKLPNGQTTNYVLSATCYGGTKATMQGSGFTIYPVNTINNTLVTDYTVTATATSGSGSITITNAEGGKGVTIPVMIKNSVITVSPASITLMPHHGKEFFKVISDVGYKSISYSSSATPEWFTLPTSLGAGSNTVNVTAKSTVETGHKSQTVTLKNPISGAPDATITVNVATTTAPTVDSYKNPSPEQNTANGKMINLYQVTNSSMQVTINSTGGSYLYSQTGGITVTGSSSTSTTNTFVVTSKDNSNGSFTIANRADNSKRLTISVSKKSAAITANNTDIPAANSGSKDIPVQSPEGVTVSVKDWNGSDQWFTFNTDVAANSNIVITQSNNNNKTMKPVTLVLKNKINGGPTEEIKITPTNFPAPTLKEGNSTMDDDYYLEKTYTLTINPTIGNYGKAVSSNPNVAIVSQNGNIVTVRMEGIGRSVYAVDITIPNLSDPTKKVTHKVTFAAGALWEDKPVYKIAGIYVVPKDTHGTWSSCESTCQRYGFSMPDKSIWTTILTATDHPANIGMTEGVRYWSGPFSPKNAYTFEYRGWKNSIFTTMTMDNYKQYNVRCVRK